jgi:hypothetical protein
MESLCSNGLSTLLSLSNCISKKNFQDKDNNVERPLEQSDSIFGEKHQEFNNTFSEIMVDTESQLNNAIFD